jgi:ABC-type glutathione transport system ATPase component
MSEKAKRAKDTLYGAVATADPEVDAAAAQAAGIDELGREPGADDAHIIHVRGLKKRYRLGKENFVDALRGASLDIRRGEMAAVMGPSGSGKSTMMHIVGCLDVPDDGEVWLNGRRAGARSASSSRGST